MTRAQSILFATPTYPPFVGGTATLVSELARRFYREGWQVTVVTTTAREAEDQWRPRGLDSLPAHHEDDDGILIRRVPIRYPRPAPYAFAIARRASYLLAALPLPQKMGLPLLQWFSRLTPPLDAVRSTLSQAAEHADIVHAVDASWDGLFGAAADCAHALGIPFVATPLIHLGDRHRAAHFQGAHQKAAYRQARTLFALSAPEAAAYASLGIPSGRIQLLTPGVDVPPPVPARQVDAFLRRNGITGKIIAFVGANTYDKGAHTLILAAARVIRDGTLVDVVLTGPGADGVRQFLARLPAEIRGVLAGRVHVLGVVDSAEKQALLSAATMLALPSRVDTFGMVFLEAWSLGRPVIGADAGGIPELIRATGGGLLVPFGDEVALAGAIQSLLADPNLAHQMGASGFAAVNARYTWDRCFERVCDSHAELVFPGNGEHPR